MRPVDLRQRRLRVVVERAGAMPAARCGGCGRDGDRGDVRNDDRRVRDPAGHRDGLDLSASAVGRDWRGVTGPQEALDRNVGLWSSFPRYSALR